MKENRIKRFNENSELCISNVIKRINDLKDEYERIRNYEYDDQWEAMARKRSIETVFYLLNIDFNEFDR